MLKLGEGIRTSSLFVHLKQKISEVLNVTETEDVGGEVADDNIWI
jgi:hypothetical protein